MQPTTHDLSALVRGLAAAYGRNGVRLEATGLSEGRPSLHLTQDPNRPGRLQTRAELEEGLRRTLAESEAWQACGEVKIIVDTRAKWSLDNVDGELQVRHLQPPYQVAAVRAGDGPFSFDLKERGVFHLQPLAETQEKHMRSLPRIAKHRILDQKLFDALPK